MPGGDISGRGRHWRERQRLRRAGRGGSRKKIALPATALSWLQAGSHQESRLHRGIHLGEVVSLWGCSGEILSEHASLHGSVLALVKVFLCFVLGSAVAFLPESPSRRFWVLAFRRRPRAVASPALYPHPCDGLGTALVQLTGERDPGQARLKAES